MTRTNLANASDLVESAAHDAADDNAARLEELAEQLDTLAEAERGPDHGRLARLESALNDVQDDENEGVVDTLDEALDAIHAYRETLDGV